MNLRYRKTLIVGNWKMNLNAEAARAFITELKPLVARAKWCDAILCVPFLQIPAAVKAARGTKIAIGAQQSRILWQFLTEAAVLTSMGGILGVATGIGLAEMMSHIMGTPVAISIPACIIAVAFSMVIGVVFGLVPAMKASKLNPIEALRRE